jgi:predicted nucleotidyltransferase
MADTKRPSASGRFVLRIDAGLHGALREAARRAKVSLNELVARKLALPGVHVGGPEHEAVTYAASLFGSELVAVAIFGSWARRELADESDVDLLIVLDDRIRITRDLYRKWDRNPISLDGRRVEPHFVHPPAADATLSGLWPEVAIDGVILFDRALTLALALASIRRAIVAARLQRRIVHGQSYWVAA